MFVTGVGGQLGHDVVSGFISRGHIAVGRDIASGDFDVADAPVVTKCEYHRLDIADAKAVEHILMNVKPDAVIHCVSFPIIVSFPILTLN